MTKPMGDEVLEWRYRPVELVLAVDIPNTGVKNVEASFARNLPRFHEMPGLGKATGPIAIVGGGPSLKSELDNLRAFPGPVMGCGTVHDYLITNGVIPKYHINGEPDADGVVLRWFQHPHPDVTYLLASFCPADIFDALADYNVRVWHLALPEGPRLPDFRGEPTVLGGSFIVGRAWPLAVVLGHTDFHFFGFDCSFPEDCESQHAYEYGWTKEEPVAAIYLGRRFVTTPGLMHQLENFVKMLVSADDKFQITIHGDSLAAATCNRQRR